VGKDIGVRSEELGVRIFPLSLWERVRVRAVSFSPFSLDFCRKYYTIVKYSE